jgi:uncharacterized protein YjiS (DUF1127 family)
MMTQPIQMFENLTSETAPAGGNASVKTIYQTGSAPLDRRLIELHARYARAEFLANMLGEAVLWLRRQGARLTAAIRADIQLRHAESQLLRMSDRELSDMGLCRADIAFAVREAAEGLMPTIDPVTQSALPANQNLRRVA